MKCLSLTAIVCGLLAGTAAAVPADELFARQAACARDNCFRAVVGNRPSRDAIVSDCVSWMQVTETPCASTTTATTTSTIYTGEVWWMNKRGLERRQDPTTTITFPNWWETTTTSTTMDRPQEPRTTIMTGTTTDDWPQPPRSTIYTSSTSAAPTCGVQGRPSRMPSYIDNACKKTIGTLVPTARYSSACSCNGFLARTTTIPAPVVTVTRRDYVWAYSTRSAMTSMSTS